jgi:hypothetical protein
MIGPTKGLFVLVKYDPIQGRAGITLEPRHGKGVWISGDALNVKRTALNSGLP